MEIMNFDARNITIKEASKLIGKSADRCCLQTG